MTKEEYRQIAHHTMNLYQVEMNGLQQKSQLVESSLLEQQQPFQSKKLKIIVNRENVLQRIRLATDVSTKVGVLNFADPVEPGGNFRQGRDGWEQAICRNTFLYPELMQFRRKYYYYNQCHFNQGLYSQKMIVSQQVKVLHDESEKSYLKPARFVDFISISAPNLKLAAKENHQIRAKKLQLDLQQRVIQILRQFKILQDEYLILGAFGCGRAGNDPQTVAEVFKRELTKPEFVGAFKEVYFSIIDERQKEIFALIFNKHRKIVLE
nr:TIGR02452 family protein [Liquorilactobacillus sicerae]